MTVLSEDGEKSEDYCEVEADTSNPQGFISDSDISSTLAMTDPVKPVECVWLIHVPVGFRVSSNNILTLILALQ